MQANIWGCGLSDSVSLSRRCTSLLHALTCYLYPNRLWGACARYWKSGYHCEVWLMTWILVSLRQACCCLGFVVVVYILVPLIS